MNNYKKVIDEKMPKEVELILEVLSGGGRESFVVGGCVRDILIGREPMDWDVATNVLPEEVSEIFESKGYSVIPTGIEHGTVTVMIDGEGYEITTYRVDGEYTDSRRPDEVSFSTSIEEDLSRRDLTINAIAYSKELGFVDLFGGMEDLKSKTIKTVGNPNERFKEDALRMMRAVRFSSQLGFDIEKSTFDAIKQNSESIGSISKERIHSELNKILLSNNPSEGISNLQLGGILKEMLVELDRTVDVEQHNPNHDKDIFNHTLEVLDNCDNPKLEVKLACLFHDIGKVDTLSIGEDGVGHFYGHDKVSAEMTETILRNLKYGNEMIDKVVFLVKHHMSKDMKMKTLKKFSGKVGSELVLDLLDLQIADLLASTNPEPETISKLKSDKVDLITLLEQKVPLSRKDLDIDVKRDLLDSGIMKPSREMSFVLEGLLDRVLESPELNKRETLLSFIEEERELALERIKNM